MFTGIIEETGKIIDVKKGIKSSQMSISASKIFSDLKIGDSVSVNGVCLTASRLTNNTFTADVMPETLNRSALGILRNGDSVNLERAMPANGRFGGHMVSGHIDGTGAILAIKKEENAIWVTIGTTDAILRYIVEKGSIAIDGISLTVAVVEKGCFKVSVIPHTALETTLTSKKINNPVNLECDIIGKYVEKLLEPKERQGIDFDFLTKHGF